MSQAQLAALERDVEQARSRFEHDLARLRSPATFSAFKDELVAEKDELVDRAKDVARNRAQRLLEDIKDKAAANPAAVLAIGAGLAWRMVHKPPIASVLVGLGLVSLLRTSPSRTAQPYMGMYDEDRGEAWRERSLAERASEMAASVKGRASEAAGSMKERASEVAGSIRQRASEVAESVKEKVQDWSAEAGEATRDTVSRLGARGSSMAERASETATTAAGQIADKAAVMTNRAASALHEAIPGQDARDKLLLGTAALAVAAAVGIAYQRRQEEQRQLELAD
jgi:hypothetical protein